MLFWKDLSGHLHKEGFQANPCDSFVVNKMANGKQCTVLWHVDNLETSHDDGDVNKLGVLAKLNVLGHGKESPLTVTRGDIHDHFGMTIDHSADGKSNDPNRRLCREHVGGCAG
jgi:hypothetical protein